MVDYGVILLMDFMHEIFLLSLVVELEFSSSSFQINPF